ncbi:MAG TPA: transposase, partial [Candidatus Avisuccinivibrio pullicola]|nr:transposase [Candidatus Avisuccinivibrio pullicola]
MAKPVFRQYRQHETMVLPPGPGDFIDENHPCRIVSDVIDRLDLSKSEATCKGGGASSYDPLMLLRVIVYACPVNVCSGRQIARLLKESVVFMWLPGMSFPDFRTISLFRSRRPGNGVFDGIFAEV